MLDRVRLLANAAAFTLASSPKDSASMPRIDEEESADDSDAGCVAPRVDDARPPSPRLPLRRLADAAAVERAADVDRSACAGPRTNRGPPATPADTPSDDPSAAQGPTASSGARSAPSIPSSGCACGMLLPASTSASVKVPTLSPSSSRSFPAAPREPSWCATASGAEALGPSSGHAKLPS